MPFTYFSRSTSLLSHWHVSMFHNGTLLPYNIAYYENFTCDDRFDDCYIQVVFAPFADHVEHFNVHGAFSNAKMEYLDQIELRIECIEPAATILPKPENLICDLEEGDAKSHCFPGGWIMSNTVRISLQKQIVLE